MRMPPPSGQDKESGEGMKSENNQPLRNNILFVEDNG
jgi:hypothetical protein